MSIQKVVLTAAYFGQTCQNVLHFSNPDTGLTLPAVAQEIRDFWLPDFKWGASGNCVWNNITVYNVSNPVEQPATLAINIPGTQSGSAQQLTFVAFIIRLRTGTAGPTGRGRIYLPGVNNNLTNLGVWTSTFLSGMDTSIQALFNKYKSGGTRPLTLGVCTAGDAGAFSIVTSMSANSIPGVQRRRNIGVGV